MTLPAPDAWPVEDPPLPSDLLAERTAATPDRTGVIDADADDSWTYAELDDLVSARVERLGTEFAPEGGRIGTLVGTGVDFATLLVAAWRVGCSLVPLDHRRDDETLVEMADRSGIDALVYEPATADTAAAVTPADATLAAVTDLPDRDSTKTASDRSSAARNGGLDPDAEWLLPFTSGTTGRPKGVRLTGRNLLASATYSAARLGVDPDDRWLACLPTCHVGGIAPFVRSTLYGTTTVFQSSFDVESTARAIDAHRITCVSLVPTMLRRLLDDGWGPPAHLRFVLLGGGPVRPALLERCERLDVPVCPTYGTTETASQVATATPETAFANPGSVGSPLDGVGVTVVDDEGSPLDAGDVGEVVVDGAVVAPGYLDEAATADAFRDDGFHTGDLGYLDEEDRLWIEGRVDDLIRTGGENVVPDAVAEVLRGHENVSDAAVVGLPDPEWGERVAAVVVPDGETVDRSALRRYCRERLAGYEVPKDVAVVGDLPRTASGTVDRERLRSLFAE